MIIVRTIILTIKVLTILIIIIKNLVYTLLISISIHLKKSIIKRLYSITDKTNSW